jgi:toxin YoeB
MGKYTLALSPQSKQELLALHKQGNKALINKIEQLFVELSEHPTTGTGKPELLKGDHSGYWSRRLNKKDRIIYRIEDSVVLVYVISMKGHYGDK